MWRFVHITDTHLSSERNGVWNNRFLCSMMPGVMDCLKKDLDRINPDFLLITGDIVSHETREATFRARDMLDALGYPYYPLGGNHDCFSTESRDWFREAYHHHLPGDSTTYTFTHKNIRFCALDPWWVWRNGSIVPFAEPEIAKKQQMHLRETRWAVPQEQVEWLAGVLRKTSNQFTCIASHYPLLPVPNRFRRPGYQDAGCLENGKTLARLLAAHPQVKLVLSGHVHTNTISRFRGALHVTTSALPEFPVEFRVVEIYPDRWTIAAQGLSDPSFAAKSRIAGHEYTAGFPRDRSATITL